MNALNLQLINELSPYEVWQTAEGDFNFETDYGVLYRIIVRLCEKGYSCVGLRNTNKVTSTISKSRRS
jgi:DNA-binding PadR family transcriptional regulator